MAVILAYDAVSGESEGGTLRLLMSAPVPRLAFLASRGFACTASLALAVGVGVLLGLACILLAAVPLRGVDLGLLGAALALLLLLLVLMVEVGLLASVAGRYTARSLAMAAASWGILAFLLPGMVSLLADSISPSPGVLDFQKQLAAVHDAFERRTTIESRMLSAIVDRRDLSTAAKMREIHALEESLRQSGKAALADYERDLAATRRHFLQRYLRQMMWRRRLGYLSPFSLVSRALERLSASGDPGLRDTLASVEAYEPAYTAALDAARVQQEARAEEQLMTVTTQDAAGRTYALKALGGLSFSKVTPQPGSLPPFDPTGVSFAVQGPAIVLDGAVLAAYVVAVAILLMWRFSRYDLR
jgi:hypothetical protein